MKVSLKIDEAIVVEIKSNQACNCWDEYQCPYNGANQNEE